MILYSQQQKALDAIKRFLASDDQVFILRGYAGTGKTTLITQIVNEVRKCDKDVRLTAPTGRAAHVLKAKTQLNASTIHRAIYRLDNIETDESDPSHIVYYFPLAELKDPHTIVTIVDEASMVSLTKVMGEIFRFGTGKLLNDLLSNCKPHSGGKIIFIGDPAQLPPVKESESQAMNKEFFLKKGLSVDSYTLTQIVRQQDNSVVLNNAMKIRDLLNNNERSSLELEVDGYEVISTEPSNLAPMMLEKFPDPDINQSAIIVPTNNLARFYNHAVRERLFPSIDHLVAGDVVMVTTNKYGQHNDPDFMNGDFLKVTKASNETTSFTETVKTERNGEIVDEDITLTFRDVTVRLQDGREHSCKIIDSLLDDIEAQLTTEQIRALFINFVKRTYKSAPNVKRGSEEFRQMLRDDPFYNALRVKYGYSITCHKAQGGEWHTVFVDFANRIGLSDTDLRWSYTAITRASNCLVAANLPRKDLLQGVNICQISKVETPRIAINAIPDTPATPFHDIESNPLLRAKYWSTERVLQETDFSIIRVESKPWCELYSINTPLGLVRVDCFYNIKNAFTRFNVAKGGNLDVSTKVLELLKQDINLEKDDDDGDGECELDYVPSTPSLNQLYCQMQDVCNANQVTIMNVEEDIEHYYVIYTLKTSGKFSQAKFFFDKKHRFTTIMPSSDLGENDEKLNRILNIIN